MTRREMSITGAEQLVCAAGKPPRGKHWRLLVEDGQPDRVDAVKTVRAANGLAVHTEDDRYVVVDVATGLALAGYSSRRCAFALVAMLAPSWSRIGDDVRNGGRFAAVAQAIVCLVRRSDVGEDDGCDPNAAPPYEIEDCPKNLPLIQKYYGYGDGCSEGLTIVLKRDEGGAKKRWAHRVRRPWGGDAEWLLFGPNYQPKRASGEEYGEIKALRTFKTLRGLLRKEQL